MVLTVFSKILIFDPNVFEYCKIIAERLAIFDRNELHKGDKGQPKARMTLRPVSTQENKHRIGLFSILYYPHRRTKKVESTSVLYHRIIGSNWNRKLVPKVNARVQFCSDPMLIFLSGNRPLMR